MAENSGNKQLIACGNDGALEGEADLFTKRVKERSKTVELVALGKSGYGNPRHPMAFGRCWVP